MAETEDLLKKPHWITFRKFCYNINLARGSGQIARYEKREEKKKCVRQLGERKEKKNKMRKHFADSGI